MMSWLADPAHSKTLGLLIFFVTFVSIVLWTYSRKRRETLEDHKNIPFLDDEDKDKTNV